MANQANLNGTPPRQRKYSKTTDRRSCDGKTKLCYRYVNHTKDGPITIWADERWKGNLEKEITQLKAAVDRCDHNPRGGGIAWAEMYDCRDGRFGAVITTYKQGAWHTHGN
jgi:hypothetical protein